MDQLAGKLTLQIFSNLEHKWLSHCHTTTKTRILTIDGGATTVIVAGASLIYLEDQIRLKTGNPNARIADFFDLLAGTGIGAILASVLVAHHASARDAVHFLACRQSEMFKIRRHAGLFCRRRSFSPNSMDRVLKEAFRSADGKTLTLKDARKPLLVPCFDLNTSAPFVFSRADASESPSFNFELWKVCRATTATPDLFKPFNLASVDGKTSCSAIDGGLVMNNPTAAAVTHVLHNKIDFPLVNSVDDLLVLSLGNGPSNLSCGRKVCRNGEYSTSSIVGIVADGVSETIDQMLANAFCWNRGDYVRIQVNDLESEGVGEANVKDEDQDHVLKEKGSESVAFGGKRLLRETNGERIESFVRRLVASGNTNSRLSLPPSPCKNNFDISPLAPANAS